MAILISIINVLCVFCGFFSRGSQIEMAGVLPYERCKKILIIQDAINYFICALLVIQSVLIIIYGGDILWFFVIYAVQLLANGVYSMIMIFWARSKRKCIVTNSLITFLNIYRNIAFKDDDELISRFCREYRDCAPQEAMRALYALRKTGNG